MGVWKSKEHFENPYGWNDYTLTWVSEQKDSFKAYLLQNENADFVFKGIEYHVEFTGADIFPQGFSAVADKLREFKGINMLCDPYEQQNK